MSLELEQLTGPVIGAAIEVHRSLGPCFIDAVYEEALAIELRERRVPFERQVVVSVLFRGHVVGLHRPDLPPRSGGRMGHDVVRSRRRALGLVRARMGDLSFERLTRKVSRRMRPPYDLFTDRPLQARRRGRG